MFRLGIIGSDNSHAEAYAKLANTEQGIDGKRVDDVRVTHIYGTDAARTREVAEAAKIPHIVERKEDMLGQVDGVLCVWRHGSKHLSETLPFLEAGIPAFVDKPLTASVKEGRQLLAAAEKAAVGFTSFSALRFAPSFVSLLAEVREHGGELTSGVFTGPADLKSEYDGIFFYGIHVVELMQTAFGSRCQSVTATAHNGNATAVCKLESGALVTLNLLGNAHYVFHAALFGTKGWQAREISGADSYYEGLKVIAGALRDNEWPLSLDELLEPVQVLTALDRSLREGREVALSEVG